jgi:FO synthase
MAWPQIPKLRAVTEEAGFELRERLTAYPEYVRHTGWIPESLRPAVLMWADAAGLVNREQEAA